MRFKCKVLAGTVFMNVILQSLWVQRVQSDEWVSGDRQSPVAAPSGPRAEVACLFLYLKGSLKPIQNA